MFNMLRQASIKHNSNTLHALFPAPSNLATQFNSVMETCVVQVKNTKPNNKTSKIVLHLIVKF